MFRLNARAWLILELCDGREGAAIERDYVEATAPAIGDAAARGELVCGVESLLRDGLIEAVAAPAAT
jgi:hypothetical protein